jgi:hypothetical protein
MKKLFLIIALIITGTFIYGQKSIDDLFNKYAGKDGFTTVTVNGGLLKLAHLFGNNDEEASIPSHVTEIRILTQEDKNLSVDNFYKMVINDIDLNKYDEFMRIKSSDQDLRMLVRSEGNAFREFLLIAGGEDNALIQIKGNLTYDDAIKISEDAKKDHGAKGVEIYK